ncbi:hypothetical protein K0M31_017924, partial [Melipona bicolor]
MNWMSSEVRGAAELGDVFTFRGLKTALRNSFHLLIIVEWYAARRYHGTKPGRQTLTYHYIAVSWRIQARVIARHRSQDVHLQLRAEQNGSERRGKFTWRFVPPTCPTYSVYKPRHTYAEPKRYSSNGRDMTVVLKRSANSPTDEEYMDVSYYFHD